MGLYYQEAVLQMLLKYLVWNFWLLAVIQNLPVRPNLYQLVHRILVVYFLKENLFEVLQGQWYFFKVLFFFF